MTSTGQGDFSRIPVESARGYSSVRLQQGRVLMDSDWNAEMDILARRLRTETRDLVGPAGAPEGSAGFGVEAEGVLSFDGQGRLLTFDAAGVAGDGDLAGFTFEARFYPRAGASPSTLLSRLVGPAEWPFAELRLDLDAEGRLTLHRVGCDEALRAEVSVTVDRLNHIAAVYDAGTATLFLNGVAVASDQQGGPLRAPEDLRFVFGAAIDGDEVRQGTDGVLLDLCMWRRALEPDEVRAGFGGRRDDQAEGLIGAWTFDRAAAAVEDRAGRGRRWLLGGGDSACAPTWVLRQLTIGGGRYYVEGLLCENPRTVPFQHQPDRPGASLPRFIRNRVYLFYLDAWELLVTAAQVPDLAEVALGGADTAARTRTVAQVGVLALPEQALDDDGIARFWESFVRGARRHGGMRARHVPSAEVLGNLLYRVEIHTSGGLYGWPRPSDPDEPALAVERLADDGAGPGRARFRLSAWPGGAGGSWRVGDRLEVWTEETDKAGRAGAPATVVALDQAALTIDVESSETPEATQSSAATTSGGATSGGGDSQASDSQASDSQAGDSQSGSAAKDWLGSATSAHLRRVATFKWSRENGSVLSPLSDVEPGGQTMILADPGRRGFELSVGDWVEYCDDDTILAPPQRPLYRVESLDESLLEVTLSGAPIATGAEAGAHPVLRRWDQRRGTGGETFAGGTVVATVGWLPLEAGIEVSFEGDGPYRATDYWCLPARTRTEQIDWPQEDGGGPSALPPLGVTHRFACLALLGFGDDGYTLRDCRKTFKPMVDGAVSKAGDSMYGPLVIRSHLAVVGGGPDDPGAVTAEVLYGPLGSENSVGTSNLADRSVTAPKLAPDVGSVPPGYAILGPTSEAPPGYAATDSAFTVFHTAAVWNELAPFPRRDPGPLRGATALGRLWVVLESGELWEYDPADGRWRARRPQLETAQDFAVAALGGLLYVIGGNDPRRGKIGATRIYDPGTDCWTGGSDLPTPRSHLALAAADGKLYALGGLARSWLGERVSRANEEYDPAGDHWTPRASLPRRRFDLGAAGAGGIVHAVGGAGRPLFGLWGRSMATAHEEYDPAGDAWRASRSVLAAPVSHPGVVALEDHLLVAGGEGALGPLAEVSELDPASGSWRRRPPLPVPAAWVAAGEVDGTVFAAADASGCPAPPLWRLPAASRFYIFRKERGETAPVRKPPREEGANEPPAPADEYAELADLDLLSDLDEHREPKV